MENRKNLKRKQYSSPEAKILMKEFTKTLAEITSYLEEREKYIVALENELAIKPGFRSWYNNIKRQAVLYLKKIVNHLPKFIIKILRNFR